MAASPCPHCGQTIGEADIWRSRAERRTADINRVLTLIARRENEGVAEWGQNYFLALDDVRDALDGV